MTRRTIDRLHRGVLGGMTVAVLALLATFYSVVASAVEQAATQRLHVATPVLPLVVAKSAGGTASGQGRLLVAGATP